jgi:hypothetical protein
MFDVSAFQPDGTSTIIGPADSGRIVTDAPKLAQRFILHLMTPTNSIPQLIPCGCDFVPRLLNGAVNEQDVFQALASALPAIGRILASEQLPTDPPDEVLVSVTIVSLMLGKGTVDLVLQLNTASSTKQALKIPLSFLIN